MEIKKVIQLMGQKRNGLQSKIFDNDYLFLKLNPTKESALRFKHKYHLK